MFYIAWRPSQRGKSPGNKNFTNWPQVFTQPVGVRLPASRAFAQGEVGRQAAAQACLPIPKLR
jgi:hypothetical protein